jgi:hypothetical protein
VPSLVLLFLVLSKGQIYQIEMSSRTRSLSGAHAPSTGRTKRIISEFSELSEVLSTHIQNGDENGMNKSLDQLIEKCKESKNRAKAMNRLVR